MVNGVSLINQPVSAVTPADHPVGRQCSEAAEHNETQDERSLSTLQ